MCKIIIAEDDRLLREDMKCLIRWEDYGYDFAGEASNGIQALKLLREKPDVQIVLTDICMPQMDGLELIREGLRLRPDLKFLVISNYSDFIYVKEAMKLGAIDYLLKYEIDKEKLLKLLNNVKNQIHQEKLEKKEHDILEQLSRVGRKKILENYLRSYIMNSRESVPLPEQLHGMETKLREGYFCMIYLKIIEDIEENRQYIEKRISSFANLSEEYEEAFDDIYMIEINKDEFCVLLRQKNKSALITMNGMFRLATEIFNRLSLNEQARVIIAMHEIGTQVQKLSESYEKVKNMSDAYFYEGRNRLYTGKDIRQYTTNGEDKKIALMQKNIITDLLNYEKDDCIADVDKMFRLFKENSYKPLMVQQHVGELLNRMQTAMVEMGISVEDMGIHNIRCYNIGEYITYIKDIIERAFSQIGLLGVKKGTRSEICRALEYIAENYKREITLEEVAAEVGLSKNHFCRLFKNEMNDNFISYVNSYRIRKAMYLIDKYDMRMKEVTVEVGMTDYRYFCKVFKKVAGVTPSDYKKVHDKD